MEYRKILVSLVALFALVAFAAGVSAAGLGDISRVEVNAVPALNNAVDIATFPGSTIPVLVNFVAGTDAQDVRLEARIIGSNGLVGYTERFDVIAGKTYSRLLTVGMPDTINVLNDSYVLEVSAESKNGQRVTTNIQVTVQRESYKVDVLSVDSESQVEAGSSLALDIVLKNYGRHFADDTFVKVSIPSLGIQRTAYFGDLAPIDQGELSSRGTKEDAAERRMLLNIPSNVPAGVYLVEVDAYNADSTTTVTKKVAIVGASYSSQVVSAAESKSFAVGEKGTYSLTLVNSGNNVRVYQLVFESASGITLEASEPVVAIPAVESKTVTITASANKPGKYAFAVDVNSNGEMVKQVSYLADVQGSSFGGNATVLLTVVLAIVFVVLLVVLIVLLTRKPQKSEEFGESYY